MPSFTFTISLPPLGPLSPSPCLFIPFSSFLSLIPSSSFLFLLSFLFLSPFYFLPLPFFLFIPFTSFLPLPFFLIIPSSLLLPLYLSPCYPSPLFLPPLITFLWVLQLVFFKYLFRVLVQRFLSNYHLISSSLLPLHYLPILFFIFITFLIQPILSFSYFPYLPFSLSFPFL